MLDNIQTLNDGTDDHTFDLVSREGMSSIRRETGVSSNLQSALTIKNTVDMASASKPNRHLIQLSQVEINSATGELYQCTVHAVISRHKQFSDATIKLMVAELMDFLSTSATLDDILLGGN